MTVLPDFSARPRDHELLDARPIEPSAKDGLVRVQSKTSKGAAVLAMPCMADCC